MICSRKYWLGVNLNPRITPRRFHLLLSSLSTAEAIWKAPPSRIATVKGMKEVAEEFCAKRSLEDLNKEISLVEGNDVDILLYSDQEYPQILRNLEYPPPVLYKKGEYKSEDSLAIAVVGTRKYSDYGRFMATKLANSLADKGFTIVSGMAKGIDTFAHQAALDVDKGRTIAVWGTGLNRVYPASNASLMNEIIQNGAVLTEFSMKQGPKRWTFPQRNRIISGLTRGTVVVEAPQQSGALITASSALEQNKEVFAVPGDVRRDGMRGTHGLIKDGAKLVENVSDIVEEFLDLRAVLGQEEQDSDDKSTPKLLSTEEKIYTSLDYDPQHFNVLAEKTGFSAARLSHILFQLQMKELVKRLDGNRWIKLA